MRRVLPLAIVAAGCSFDPTGVSNPGAGDDAIDADVDAAPGEVDASPIELADAAPEAPVTCPAGYVDGLRWVDEPASWPTARGDCADDLPGVTRLVVIHDDDKNAAVDALAGGDTTWIGATDAAAEGTWLDVLDEPQTYHRWSLFEPNNGGLFGSDEDCAEVRNGGAWNDQDCGAARRYVCECVLAP